ncbi:MAG: SH3 domain-containing protein, partial [Bacteroidota bacterium]
MKTGQILCLILFTSLFAIAPNKLFGQDAAIVRGTNVNVRAGAGTQYGVVFQVNTGDRCKLLGSENEEEIVGFGYNYWYQIDFGGQVGYVYGAFLDFIFNNAQVNQRQYAQGSIQTVTANQVNVRDCASLECNKLFQLNESDIVEVVARSNPYFIQGLGAHPWYKIQYKGQSAYIFGAFVDCSNCDFNSPIANNTPSSNLSSSSPSISSGDSSSSGTITGDGVNIRSCTSTQNCDVLFQLDLGVRANIIQKVQNQGEKYPWYEIDYQGQTGYVYGQFFAEEGAVSFQNVKVWAIIVGVSDYSTQLNNLGVRDLNYSDDDAKRMYQFLKSPQGGSLPESQISLLRDNEATNQSILRESERLFQQAGPKDLVIVYFSGHGGPNYFVAHDRPLKYSDIKEVVERSPANKRLCIADACYSGTWSNNSAASSTR